MHLLRVNNWTKLFCVKEEKYLKKQRGEERGHSMHAIVRGAGCLLFTIKGVSALQRGGSNVCANWE